MLFCNRRSRQSEHQRLVFSILCTGRCKPLGSFHMHLSYLEPIMFPCSPFDVADGFLLHSPSSSAVIFGWWRQIPLDHSLWIPHSHLEARNCWWWWCFIFIGNGRRYFHFTTISLSNIYGVLFLSSVVLSLECEDNCWVRENLHRNTGPLSYEVEYWLPVWITSEFEAGQGQERAAAVSGPG